MAAALSEDIAGQKRPRVDATPGGVVANEAQYKSKLVRLLKYANADTVVDILATMGAHYQPVHDEIMRVLDADVSARKLFVRNLPFDVDDAAVRGIMAEFGAMTECTVAKDRATGKGRGFAFVTYEHVEDADKAIVAKSRMLAGREIFFSNASERDHKNHDTAPPAAHPPPPPFGGMPMGSFGGFPPGMPRPPPPPHMLMMGLPPPPSLAVGGGTGGSAADREARRFMVRNLSWQTTNDTLRHAFLPYGEVEEAAIPQDRETGKSRGYGFVVMKYLEGSQAVQMGPPAHIDGRDVQVSIAAAGRDGSGMPVVAAAAATAARPAPPLAAVHMQQAQQQQAQQQQAQQMQQHQQMQQLHMQQQVQQQHLQMQYMAAQQQQASAAKALGAVGAPPPPQAPAAGTAYGAGVYGAAAGGMLYAPYGMGSLLYGTPQAVPQVPPGSAGLPAPFQHGHRA